MCRPTGADSQHARPLPRVGTSYREAVQYGLLTKHATAYFALISSLAERKCPLRLRKACAAAVLGKVGGAGQPSGWGSSPSQSWRGRSVQGQRVQHASRQRVAPSAVTSRCSRQVQDEPHAKQSTGQGGAAVGARTPKVAARMRWPALGVLTSSSACGPSGACPRRSRVARRPLPRPRQLPR